MTQRPWAGKLFVFRDSAGEHVSLTSPNTKEVSCLRAFRVWGPFIPIALQKTVSVPDIEQWLDNLHAKGFTWEPCSVEA